MQYLLMAYVDEAGWPKLSKSEQEQGIAAYAAYGEALKTSGVMKGSNRLQPSSVVDDGAEYQRQAASAGWALCRFEGAAGRLLSDRRTGSGCRAFVGFPLPRGQPWSGGSAAGLEHVSLTGLPSLEVIHECMHRRRGAQHSRRGCAPQLRQTGRFCCRAQPRPGCCGGRALRSLRFRTAKLAAKWLPGKSGSMAADCGPAQADRQDTARARQRPGGRRCGTYGGGCHCG